MNKKIILVVFCLLLFFLVGNSVWSATWEDEFCNSTNQPTNMINLTHVPPSPPLSFNYKYYCSVSDYIGLNDTYDQYGNLNGSGVSEMNVSVGSGSSYIWVEVPNGVVLEYFNISLEGIEVSSQVSVPVGIVLVTDTSGSMSRECNGSCNYHSCSHSDCFDSDGCRMCDAKNASSVFVQTIFNGSEDPDTRMGLVSYGRYNRTNATWFTYSQVDECLTDNSGNLFSEISNYYPSGNTDIVSGVILAHHMLNNYPFATDVAKVIVVMTDGNANRCNGSYYGGQVCAPNSLLRRISRGDCVTNSHSQAIDEAESVGDDDITMFTVGFGSTPNNNTLMQMAAEANDVSWNSPDEVTGEYFFFAPDRDTLADVYEQIALKISSSQPQNVSINVGNQATPQWEHTGPLDTNEEVDLAQWIMDIANNGCNCPAGGCHNSTDETSCFIKISFDADTSGNVTLSDLESQGSYGFGRIVSETINATEKDPAFAGWDHAYFTFDFPANTGARVRILEEGLFVPTCGASCGGSCPSCMDAFYDSDGTYPCDLTCLGTTPDSLQLLTILNSSGLQTTPHLKHWQLDFFASSPTADAGGPVYHCTSGDPSSAPKFAANKSYEEPSFCPRPGYAPSCPGVFEYEWIVSNSSGPILDSGGFSVGDMTWTCDVAGSECHRLSPGDYEVTVTVKNTVTDLTGSDTVRLEVHLPAADLKIDNIQLVEPVYKDFESSSSVSIRNDGGQGALYNITFEVINSSGVVIDRKSYDESDLSGASLRKRVFVWTPNSAGQYKVNATLYNSTNDYIEHLEVDFFVSELASSPKPGFEYSELALLVVLIAVPLIVFYARRR